MRNMKRKYILNVLNSIQINSKKGVSCLRKLFLCFLCFNVILLLYLYSPYSITISISDFLLGLFTGFVVLSCNFAFSYFKINLIRRGNYVCAKKKISTSSIMDSIFPTLLLRIIFIIVFATIEEYIFRSYILSFTNMYFSIPISIILNAVLFYLFHLNSKVFELLFMGIVFSLLTIYTNNILTAIVAHAVNNLLVYFVKKGVINRVLLNKL